MPGNTDQNRPNANTFSQDPNIADKHMQFAGQNQPQAQQPKPVSPSQPYLNPNNFKQVLGQEQPVTQQPVQTINTNAPIPPMPVSYPEATKQAHVKPAVKVNSSDTFKLVIYVVPLIAVFILAMKSIDDKETMWHVRQSLLMQGIWFAVLIIIKLVELPIISDYGLNLWNIICYILLILAGIQAYNNERYHIPIVYEIGEKFIEG